MALEAKRQRKMTMSDLQSKTPICKANTYAASTGDADAYSPDFVPLEIAEKLELAANGLRERLAARQWVQYVDAEGEVWAACSDCLQSPEEGHAPNCETALALSAFATLTKQPAEPSK